MTTRVGQAQELVDDVDALVEAVVVLADDVDLRRRLVGAGRATAEAYALELLDPRWVELLDGFVEPSDGGR